MNHYQQYYCQSLYNLSDGKGRSTTTASTHFYAPSLTIRQANTKNAALPTSVQGADAHGGVACAGVTKRLAVWLVDHTKVHQAEQLQHNLPGLGADEVADDLAVSAADGLVDRDIEGRIACRNGIATEEGDGRCLADSRRSLQDRDDHIDAATPDSLV